MNSIQGPQRRQQGHVYDEKVYFWTWSIKRVAFKKVGRFSGHRATWRYHFRVGFVSTACWRGARTYVRATPKAGRGLVVTADIFLNLGLVNGSHYRTTPSQIVIPYVFGSLLPLLILGEASVTPKRQIMAISPRSDPTQLVYHSACSTL